MQAATPSAHANQGTQALEQQISPYHTEKTRPTAEADAAAKAAQAAVPADEIKTDTSVFKAE